MENLGFLIFLLILWAIGQAMRARENRKRQQPPRGAQAPRQPQPERRTAEEQITLEEWMERVRRGQLPTARPQRQQQRQPSREPQRAEAGARPPRDPEAILWEWQQRTGREQQPRRATPVRTPPPTVRRRETETYETPEERTRRMQQEERAQRQALAREREREQRALERRELDRRAERARRMVVAVPQPEEGEAAREPLVAPRVAPTLPRLPRGRDVYTERARRRARRPHGLDLSRGGLRNGILLAEILGPPIALRPPQARSRFARIGDFV